MVTANFVSVPSQLEDSCLFAVMKEQIQLIALELDQLSTRLVHLNRQIIALAKQSSDCQLLMSIFVIVPSFLHIPPHFPSSLLP
jgi:hypothetical protein